MFPVHVIIHVKMVKYDAFLGSIVDTDSLVPEHQGISTHSTEYAQCVSSCFKG